MENIFCFNIRQANVFFAPFALSQKYFMITRLPLPLVSLSVSVSPLDTHLANHWRLIRENSAHLLASSWGYRQKSSQSAIQLRDKQRESESKGVRRRGKDRQNRFRERGLK